MVPEFSVDEGHVWVPRDLGEYIFSRLDAGNTQSTTEIFKMVQEKLPLLRWVSVTRDVGYLAFQSPAPAQDALKSLPLFTFTTFEEWYYSTNNLS